ncbi:MAG: HAMP domain-containing sensor histidine kinase [Breznakibacter sp.]
MAALTFMALVVLVVIQVTWILKAADLEEQNFNHRVALALKQVRSEIGKRAKDSDHMKDFLCGNHCTPQQKELKVKEIDSIVYTCMQQHDIDLHYDFFVGDSTAQINYPAHKKYKCYLQSLNGLIEKDGIRIGMHFPQRNQFIMAQMKGWFAISILFILFVGLSFLFMLRLFLRERALLVQTTDFINNMVHEFQTPITNMRLAASLIRKKEASISDPKIMEYTGVILAENTKMENNVNEILKIASLEHTALEPVMVDMHQLITQTATHYKLRANNFDGDIETKLHAAQFIVKGNTEHLSLMISNLVDNALKYSPEKPTVHISTRNDKQWLVINVQDNGIGIAKKDQLRIFDKYFRVSTGNVHNVKGFGLGLTYVKTITELYGGSIEVQSIPSQGSTFSIKLPYQL